MNNSTDQILENLFRKKGQFSRAVWGRFCKVRVGSPEIKKVTVMVARAGVQYDNLKSVQEKRENGELPAENAGLPWGEWEQYPYLIKHKGQRYVRLYPVPNTSCKVEYFINGKAVSYDSIVKYLLASELKKEQSPDCIVVKLCDIIELS